MKKSNIAFLAVAASVLMLSFTQCNTPTSAPQEATSSDSCRHAGLNVAYVDVDTLLTSYELWVSLNEDMINKRENITATVNKEGAALQKEMEQFQNKLNNNAFVSQERAESEYNRLMKKQQDLQAKQERLANEFAVESSRNDQVISDSVRNFIKVYSREKGYDLILNSASTLFVGDAIPNVTREVAAGLNARYGKQ